MYIYIYIYIICICLRIIIIIICVIVILIRYQSGPQPKYVAAAGEMVFEGGESMKTIEVYIAIALDRREGEGLLKP